MRCAVFLIVLLIVNSMMAQQTIIKQGHRGCRGLMPENTIEAMKKAIDLNVDVLELDVVVSQDKQVVLSHEPYMEADFCLKPDGQKIGEEEENRLLLYQMPYNEIKLYDVGSKPHPVYKQQQRIRTYKPLLAEVIDSSDAYAKRTGKPLPKYNIEIKSSTAGDRIAHPEPAEFVALVLDVCNVKNVIDRMNIQSFDERPLRILHAQDSSIRLSYLVQQKKSVDRYVKDLGFTPHILSPYYLLVDRQMVVDGHKRNMQIIPWTVNDREWIKTLAGLGVDGIITDYPNYFQ
jgi:glycerophosphoryl diester phosphodiesterase